MKSQELEYQEPLDFFKQLDLCDQTAVFLYSSTSQSYSGKYSVIALFPTQLIKTNDFSELSQITIDEKLQTAYFSSGYFGYISYDVKNQFEKLPIDQSADLKHPLIQFASFAVVYVFYHSEKKMRVYFDSLQSLEKVEHLKSKKSSNRSITIAQLHSNFTKSSYISAIEKVKEYIFAGDIFEANLTRKYFGEFSESPDASDLFVQLVQKSPSQYSAFMKFDDLLILSASPERFLKIKGRQVNSKPIKGTRPRSTDPDIDNMLINDLQTNEKDLAENLMIVDLVRNDLGRTAEIGSVSVPDLFKVESYETVHQLVSTIEARISDQYSIFDTIRSAFPPGSMTGAPKIRAMEIISELEKLQRGIYSGAIGYIGTDSYVDLSVVIRTLIIKNRQFEFQVGGAIVADSDPEAEYQEILDKAKAIASVLNIDLINFQ